MQSIITKTKNHLSYRFQNFTILSFIKYLVGIVAVGHLILSNIHIEAILKLENNICGFVLFLFILFGLVSLFGSFRIKKNKLNSQLFAIFAIVITIIMGLIFVSINISAINNQQSLKEPIYVIKSLILSGSIIALYLIALGSVIITIFKNTKLNKKTI